MRGGARFASVGMAVALVAWLVAVAAIGVFSARGDGVVYYAFLRHVFRDTDVGPAYQFGATLWDAPFYAAAKLVNWIGGVDVREASLAVATTTAVFLLAYVSWRLLRRLELPHGPLLVALVFVGTPTWYYALFYPAQTHTLDALVLTLATLLLVAASETEPGRVQLALGACLGFLPAIRYANVALLPGLLLPFVLARRPRALVWTALAAALTALVVFALPLVLGIHYGSPTRQQLGGRGIGVAVEGIHVSVLAPLKMLLTLHRGLFLWTPLTLLGTVGFAAFLRRDRRFQLPLLGLAVASVCLLTAHAAWARYWDGGWSFSERFLTALYPVFLIGTAEAVRLFPRAATAAAGLAAAWSLFIGINHYYGHAGLDRRDGVDAIVAPYVHGERTIPELVRLVGIHVARRWGLR